jgi:hypothetical protein
MTPLSVAVSVCAKLEMEVTRIRTDSDSTRFIRRARGMISPLLVLRMRPAVLYRFGFEKILL